MPGADWSVAASSANGNTVLYAGRELDLATSLYYNRARYYDPGLGRFISTDPAQADENTYRYCGDEPTQATDPSGLWTQIKRDKESGWGFTCAKSDADTWASLATLVHLDPSQYKEWVRVVVPREDNIVNGMIVVPDKPVVGYMYGVPNTVVEYQMASTWGD